MGLSDYNKSRKTYSFYKTAPIPLDKGVEGSNVYPGEVYGQVLQWDGVDWIPTTEPEFQGGVGVVGNLSVGVSGAFKTIEVVSGNLNLAAGEMVVKSGVYQTKVNSSSIVFDSGNVTKIDSGMSQDMLTFYDVLNPNGITLSSFDADFMVDNTAVQGIDSIGFNETGNVDLRYVTSLGGGGDEQCLYSYMGEGHVVCCVYSSFGSSTVKNLIYKSYDYGESWTLKYKNDSVDSVVTSIEYIGNGVVLAYEHIDSGNYMLRSVDYGETWSRVSSAAFSDVLISGMIRARDNNLFAVGAKTSDSNKLVILKSTNEGLTWSQNYVGLYKGQAYVGSEITANIMYLGRDILIIGVSLSEGGECNLYRTVDNGVNWTPLLAVDHSGYVGSFGGFINFGGGVIVGVTYGIGPGEGYGYRCVRSTNYGSSWTALNIAATANIRSCVGCGGNRGMLVDEVGNVYETVNKGLSYKKYTTMYSGTYRSIKYLDDGSFLYGIKSNGIVLKNPGRQCKHVIQHNQHSKVRQLTGSYNLTELDNVVVVMSSSAEVYVRVPESCSIGRTYEIKDMTGYASTNNIKVTGSYGNLFEGSFYKLINSDYGSMRITHIQSGSWGLF